MNRRNYGDSLVNKEAVVSCSQEPCDFSRGRFRMPLRLDIDEDLINFVEEHKENGKSPTEVFREVGVFYLDYQKKEVE